MEFPVSHPVQKNLQAPSHSLQFNSLSQYTNCAKNFHQNGVYGFVSYSGPHIINIGNLNPNSGTSIGQKLSQPKSRRDTTSHPWRWPLTNKQMSVGEDVENLVPVHCWLECGTVRPLRKTVWRFFKPLNIELPCDPAISLLGIQPKKELKAGTWRDICTLDVHKQHYSHGQKVESTHVHQRVNG